MKWKFWTAFSLICVLLYVFTVSGGFAINISDFKDMEWNFHNFGVLAVGVSLLIIFFFCILYCAGCIFECRKGVKREWR